MHIILIPTSLLGYIVTGEFPQLKYPYEHIPITMPSHTYSTDEYSALTNERIQINRQPNQIYKFTIQYIIQTNQHYHYTHILHTIVYTLI